MSDQRVVIVGGGATGFQVAEGLRQRGFGGQIVVVEPEEGLPYDRPPLSKQFLVGTWDEARVRLRERDVFDALEIEQVTGATAVDLVRGSRTVTLSDGRDLAYDWLVVATGASPVLPEAWRVSPRVMTFRRFADSVELGGHLRAGRSVAVIGAGMIGSELASSARSLGLDVTLIDASPTPLQPLVGPEVAAAVRGAHEASGVCLLTGTSVLRVSERQDGSVAVDLAVPGGEDPNLGVEQVVADVIVVAVGVRPEVQWLADSGLRLENGVVCDAHCEAADRIFAGGDVAAVRHDFLGSTLRFEQRTMTTEHARVIVDRILGGQATVEAVPYYWSDQHHRRLQGCGLTASQVERVDSIEVSGATLSVFSAGGVVRGAAVHGGPKLFPRLLRAVKDELPTAAALELFAPAST